LVNLIARHSTPGRQPVQRKEYHAPVISLAKAFAAALAVVAGAASAQNDSGKKTSDGIGNLFRGMGQELDKAGGSGTKKDAKKQPKKTSAQKADAPAAK
jgi:hypothetical protein